ncbi:hypothetical protein MMC07_006741 [Pseudocyphellaria aurata]|nr:hypothetical protein [Pseudocyphellaria aurata]
MNQVDKILSREIMFVAFVVLLPFAKGRNRQLSFLVDEESDGSEPPQNLSESGPAVVDLTGEDHCSTPSLQSMEAVKRVRPSLHHPGSPSATPASNLRSARKRARSTSQKSADSRSSSSERSHLPNRRAGPEASNAANTTKVAKSHMKESSFNYPTSRFRRTGLKKAMPKRLLVRPAELRKTMPKSLLPAPGLRQMTPEDSAVEAQLISAPPLSTTPESRASPPKPSPSKDVIFHFFLADEAHGAIPHPLENCDTMSSFFDEALAAWGALGEDQLQPRMAAVKVSMEGISRPVVVLWRNKEGFSRMMDMVREQAAEKQSKFHVEVRCFKRG